MIYNDLMFLRTSATIMINGLERERETERKLARVRDITKERD